MWTVRDTTYNETCGQYVTPYNEAGQLEWMAIYLRTQALHIFGLLIHVCGKQAPEVNQPSVSIAGDGSLVARTNLTAAVPLLPQTTVPCRAAAAQTQKPLLRLRHFNKQC